MFGSDVLDVAIGLVFVYLLLSLVCSAANEIIEARLKRRAVLLERGIRELVGDERMAEAVYNHPLVRGLFVGHYEEAKAGTRLRGSRLPTYIPARNFALALMDTVLNGPAGSPAAPADGRPAPREPAVPPSCELLRERAGRLEAEGVRRAVLALTDAAGGDLGRARANIEDWYNSSMDQVSGWYKRHAQVVILVLGLAVSCALNADTIAIGTRLASDPALRNSLVASAQEYARAGRSPTTSPSPDPSSPIEACRRDSGSPECGIEKNYARLRGLGLPVGWDSADPRLVPPWDRAHAPQWAMKFFGWLLTAFAVSLGAAFWFDLLDKFMVVRSTVKPHEKSPEEGSND